jgi:hypothetical protein
VERLEAGDQGRRGQGRRELKCQEERRDRERAPRLVQDEQSQRNLSQPIAQLVDEAGQGQPTEGR